MMRFSFGRLLLLSLLALVSASTAVGVQAQGLFVSERLLDDFHDPAAWALLASDDVQARLRPDSGGASLCVDFDFGRVTGYVAVRRPLPIDFPARYRLELALHGDMLANDVQVKFVDASGENVWWARRPGLRLPADAGQPLRWRQRQIEFAWGPAKERRLERTEVVELVIASGSGAGKGSVCFDRLSLRELPPEPASPARPSARAGSALPGHPAAAAIDGDPTTDWQPGGTGEDAGVLTIDYGRPREFGSLTLRWRDAATAARRYRIAFSDDGVDWRDHRQVDGASGAVQPHFFADAEARFVRIAIDESLGRPVALAEVELGDAPTADAFFSRLAHAAPRGRYPRAYLGEQPYWTVFGVDGGPVASLLGEDGVVEPLPGVGALEPFLQVDGRVLGWADVAISQSLRDGDLPMPSVHWRAEGLTLDIDAFAIGTPQTRASTAPGTPPPGTPPLKTPSLGTPPLGTPPQGTPPQGAASQAAPSQAAPSQAAPSQGTPSQPTPSPAAPQAIVRYRLRNTADRARSITLALAWRPFQVNPPTQFLAYPGGASRIERMAWDGRALRVDGAVRLQALSPPASVRLEPLAAGPAPDWLGESASERAGAAEVVDPAGFASGVLRFPVRLEPGESHDVVVALPLTALPPPATMTLATVAAAERRVARHWRERLDRVAIAGPAEVTEIAETLRSALGQVLVNRSGPALQPGSRAYARSWIRDGALTSSALLRLGQDDVVRDFLRWYAPFQFRSGKIPCCATARGADPVPENDSDGEFIYAAAELWRYTRNTATAEQLWPHARAALDHMESLRQSERRAENLAPERRAYFGLMPPSISHEGYSDRPAYSYWDDFWAAIGYRSAADWAAAMGKADDARRIAAQRDEFTADLLASLVASAARHGLDLLPGSADRGDIDPTSSTVALSPGDLLGTLPDSLVRNTFDRYWRDFLERRDSGKPWDAYTPYEWRNVGALIRLGEREKALQAMAFFYRDRRPPGWHQWAEVVLREPRAPRFLGDMPHGWVASDQIRSVLDLFAYEGPALDGLAAPTAALDRSLVLMAGIPMRWLEVGGPALKLTQLRTPYGPLSWQARGRRVGGRRVVDFALQRLDKMPTGGIELRGPWPAASTVRIDGRTVAGPSDRIRLTKTPARVRIVLPDT